MSKAPGYAAESFMSTITQRMIGNLKKLGHKVTETFGYITSENRKNLGLEKTHYNDAFVISGNNNQNRCQTYYIKQVRNQNRKLFKGKRSEINNKCSRFVFGFQQYDKVLYNKIECFIFARRSKGYFDVRLLNGKVISSSVSYKKLKLLESRTPFLSTLLKRSSDV